MGPLAWIKMAGLAVTLVGGWFIYGWGSQIVSNYGQMAGQITTLKRDKALVESRVESMRTLLARRDAAIEASRCKAQIEHWLKNPDEIPTKWDPFGDRR